MRSSTSSRAVSISTGVQSPAARMRAADVEPVAARHEHVEDHRVGRSDRDPLQRGVAVRGLVDDVAVDAQGTAEGRPDRRIVVHHEEAHVRDRGTAT